MHHLHTFILAIFLTILAVSCGKKEASAAPDTGITSCMTALAMV